MSVHVCRMLLAPEPSYHLTETPLNLATSFSCLFRAQMWRKTWCQIRWTLTPLCPTGTELAQKSEQLPFLELGLAVSFLPEERWDICSLNRFLYSLFLAESHVLSPKYKTLNV